MTHIGLRHIEGTIFFYGTNKEYNTCAYAHMYLSICACAHLAAPAANTPSIFAHQQTGKDPNLLWQTSQGAFVDKFIRCASATLFKWCVSNWVFDRVPVDARKAVCQTSARQGQNVVSSVCLSAAASGQRILLVPRSH